MELCDGQLKEYSTVTSSFVEWLWYPYIPFGKVTLLQGDPGCGKSTLMMNIIAAVSTGGYTPDGIKLKKASHVIYQCSEDGISDTIKPRLEAANADCSRIAFLDEELEQVTLGSDILRRAIAEYHAKLLIVDPVQAYLGDTDMASAIGMRKVLRNLSKWAELYECAIVLIGHLNKKNNAKDIYRGLGSIDFIAVARSVLQIERREDDTAVINQIKNSLAPKGKARYFRISEEQQIEWFSYEEEKRNTSKNSKQEAAGEKLKELLMNGPMKSTEVYQHFADEAVSHRTLTIAKKNLNIQSLKKEGVWYWKLP